MEGSRRKPRRARGRTPGMWDGESSERVSVQGVAVQLLLSVLGVTSMHRSALESGCFIGVWNGQLMSLAHISLPK